MHAGMAGRDRDPPTRRLEGGIVAFNEEDRIDTALSSLLDADLLPGWTWGTIWVVASGCTDRTVEIARRRAEVDPRVRVIVEPERTGKASALAEILRRARGDALVLLNSDARAAPGALARMLAHADPRIGSYAVMARPVPDDGEERGISGMVRLLWDVHDQFHRELAGRPEGNHLSDELLLIGLPPPATFPAGIINDGSYLGATLARRGGLRIYEPDAVVLTAAPRALKAHLIQRRRILVGHAQVERLLGVAPAELPRYAARHPGAAVRLLRRAMRRGGHRARDLGLLVFGELAARSLARWDRLPPERDHRRWEKATPGAGPASETRHRRLARSRAGIVPAAPSAHPDRTTLEERVAALLGVARRFRTGISLEELSLLLPSGAPRNAAEIGGWLGAHPDLAQVEAGRAYGPGSEPEPSADREARAERYRRAAELLVGRDLSGVHGLIRYVGISGSTAYGVPQAGDDLDLFLVARPGALWVVLAYAYFAVRFRFRPTGADDRPMPCLNLVLDETLAREEFRVPRDFLFAREALSVRTLRGEEYYRGLLASAPWMDAELPRLYRSRAGTSPDGPSASVPWGIRAANSLLFPFLATYLQLAGLVRNRTERRRDGDDPRFRTITTRRKLALVSVRFERLRRSLAVDSAMPTPVGTDPIESGAPTYPRSGSWAR